MSRFILVTLTSGEEIAISSSHVVEIRTVDGGGDAVGPCKVCLKDGGMLCVNKGLNDLVYDLNYDPSMENSHNGY